MTISVIAQSDSWIAVSKPTGRLVIPGRGTNEPESLSQELTRTLGFKIFVVHRIDVETSGLVLFAKNAESHRFLCQQFESRNISKTYLALVQGRLEGSGEINKPLKEFGSGRTGMHAGGKPSLTRYKAREVFENSSLLEVELMTGRRHQIRAHFYSIGHPVLGDTRYGEKLPVGGAARLMLHAWKLAFQDESGRSVNLKCEPGEDFKSAFKAISSQDLRFLD